MRERPFLVAVVCSFVAATALVISEGALAHVHLHQGGNGTAPQSQSGSATQQQNPGSTVAIDQSAPSLDGEPTGQTADDSTSYSDSSQSPQSGSGGIDPGSVTKLLPVQPPTIGP